MLLKTSLNSYLIMRKNQEFSQQIPQFGQWTNRISVLLRKYLQLVHLEVNSLKADVSTLIARSRNSEYCNTSVHIRSLFGMYTVFHQLLQHCFELCKKIFASPYLAICTSFLLKCQLIFQSWIVLPFPHRKHSDFP